MKLFNSNEINYIIMNDYMNKNECVKRRSEPFVESLQ